MENTTCSQNRKQPHGPGLATAMAIARAPQASLRAEARHLPHPQAWLPRTGPLQGQFWTLVDTGCHTDCRGDQGERGDVSRGATWAVPCLTVEETEVQEGHGGPHGALGCDTDAEPSAAHGPELRVGSASHCPRRLPSKRCLLQRGPGCTLHTPRGGPRDQAQSGGPRHPHPRATAGRSRLRHGGKQGPASPMGGPRTLEPTAHPGT